MKNENIKYIKNVNTVNFETVKCESDLMMKDKDYKNINLIFSKR